jgi:hypothetical protein
VDLKAGTLLLSFRSCRNSVFLYHLSASSWPIKRFFTALASLMGARRVLELGTFTGYSALCFAQGIASRINMKEAAVDDNTKQSTVVTCEIDERASNIAQTIFTEADKYPEDFGKVVAERTTFNLLEICLIS